MKPDPNIFPGRRRSFAQERTQTEAQKLLNPGATTTTAADATPQEAAKEERGALEEAKQFLAGLLTNGPVPATAVRSEAEAAGHSWAAIRRAKKVLGVESFKDGMKRGWVWRLSSKALRLAEDACPQTRSGS